MGISSSTAVDTARILAQLKAGAPALLAQYPVRLAYVYGSVARGQATPLSDVDVGVLFDETLSDYDQFKSALRLACRLQDVVETQLEVEARVMNTMSIDILGAIVTEGVCLYARSDADREAYEKPIRQMYASRRAEARRKARRNLLRMLELGLEA